MILRAEPARTAALDPKRSSAGAPIRRIRRAASNRFIKGAPQHERHSFAQHLSLLRGMDYAVAPKVVNAGNRQSRRT
jgi:hypothetical protein